MERKETRTWSKGRPEPQADSEGLGLGGREGLGLGAQERRRPTDSESLQPGPVTVFKLSWQTRSTIRVSTGKPGLHADRRRQPLAT